MIKKLANSKYLRYLAGFLLLAIILCAFYFSKTALIIVSAFFIIVAMAEYRNMYKQKEIYPHPILPELFGIVCAYIFIQAGDLSSHHLVTPLTMAAVIFSFIITIIRNKKPYIETSLSTIAAILFIFCGLYIIKLTYYFEHENAWYLILVYFLAVLAGDWIASIVGKNFEKKLAPEISPNKTIAGAIANIITSCLACLLLAKLLGFSILSCLLLGAIISIFAQFGDLTVSAIKRDLDIKHSGSFFFEYGGVLDRMDSFIFSAPAAYYFLFLATAI